MKYSDIFVAVSFKDMPEIIISCPEKTIQEFLPVFGIRKLLANCFYTVSNDCSAQDRNREPK
jgi:hypothetical protein